MITALGNGVIKDFESTGCQARGAANRWASRENTAGRFRSGERFRLASSFDFDLLAVMPRLDRGIQATKTTSVFARGMDRPVKPGDDGWRGPSTQAS
jgi:hypothetical protein